MAEVAYIEVDGTRLPVWDQYSVDSDMTIPSDGFSFSVSLANDSVFSQSNRRVELRRKLYAGAHVALYVGQEIPDRGPRDRFLQMTGIIDESSIEVTRDGGTVISLQGRDIASYLVDSSIALDLRVSTDMRLLTLLERAVEPWGIEVVADSFAARETLRGNIRRRSNSRVRRQARSAGVPPELFSLSAQAEAERTGRPLDEVVGADFDNDAGAAQARNAARGSFANSLTQSDIQRLRVKDVRPTVGETVWAFCERHCKRLGLLMWMSPDGRLIVSSPNYTQEPSYSAIRRYRSSPSEPNNILKGSVTQSIGERFSSVTCYGKGNPRNGGRNLPQGTATDEGWPGGSLPKVHILQDPEVTDDEQAERRAIRELNLQKKTSFILNYELAGHGQGQSLFSIDTIINVVDESIGVNGNFYITRRTFQRDRENGTTTAIQAMPVGQILL